ncbi:hypothetical protein EDD90_3270 [Streptomyces sp. Ag109_O5-1]|uniref:hypothetical protein n=1 Tax=Streptomyces sp. Ag109_O5-1 TaxID=1938851 RepID=UPI000F4EF65B|nr:hypothetical protein [Streptomyces sp. Ag109_O5-1]RPE40234.1 hypothetical protein EDD90_3270 [Streptomyces sp. Ag109_O5-1]
MTDRSTGPRCGNNPNTRLTPGDRKAVDDFKARLALQAAAKPYIESAAWVDFDPLMEVIAATVWGHCARDDAEMPQLVRDDPRTIAAFAAAVARAHAAAAPAAATDQTALRDRIADALRVHYHCPGDLDPDGPIPCACGWMDPGPDATHETDFDAHMADVVLGVLTGSVPPPTDPAERHGRYAQAVRAAADTAYGNSPFYDAVTAAVIAVADAEQAELRRDRDLAIAHDRQPYPTAWAYEQACKALRRKTEAIERVRALHAPDGNGECQHCHHSAPCPTVQGLDDGPRP